MNRKIRFIVAAILAAGSISTVTALAASSGTSTGTTLSGTTSVSTSTTVSTDGWTYPGWD